MPEEDWLAGLDFRHMVRDVQKGLLLKPILHNYLFDASFPEFSLHFEKEDMERKPDGWFHPSTHPLWSERQLFAYLAFPELMLVEKKEYMSTLSVTFGKVTHTFIEVCLEDAGLRPAALNVCTVCPPEKECQEPGVEDSEAGERGHMDGVLDLSHLSIPSDAFAQPAFEFKTTNDMKLSKVADLDIETYRAKWPEYYAQAQSYMRMSGRRMMVVLFMALGFPWQMKEFHIPFDPAFSFGVRDKYLKVRQGVADQSPIGHCCKTSARHNGCGALGVCTKIASLAAPEPTGLIAL